jgi:replicative DNA helicase
MIKTGIQELDSFWKIGLQGGGLILLAARPAMGKASFLVSIGKLISRKHKTLLFSLAYSADALKRRTIIDSFGSLLLDDSPELNTEHLAEKIARTNTEVVLIDYLQLLTGNRETMIQDLKKIAINANICMVVNSQIGREPEYRALSERRPVINDLTVSRIFSNLTSLSYIDNLTFMYRDHYYKLSSHKADFIELIQYANNNTYSVKLDWNILN